MIRITSNANMFREYRIIRINTKRADKHTRVSVVFNKIINLQARDFLSFLKKYERESMFVIAPPNPSTKIIIVRITTLVETKFKVSSPMVFSADTFSFTDLSMKYVNMS